MIVNLLLISEEIGFQCSKVIFPKLEIGSVEIQTQTGPTTKLFFPQRHSDHQIILLQPILFPFLNDFPPRICQTPRNSRYSMPMIIL